MAPPLPVGQGAGVGPYGTYDMAGNVREWLWTAMGENRMVAGFRLANLRIYQKSQSEPNLRGMGTTVVGCLINGDHCYVAHVGDSRVYRIRDGEIRQLTRDHSLFEDYKDARPDMTEEEARNFPHKNVITRALGMREERRGRHRQVGDQGRRSLREVVSPSSAVRREVP